MHIAENEIRILPTEQLRCCPDIVEGQEHVQDAVAYFHDIQYGRDPGLGFLNPVWLSEGMLGRYILHRVRICG